MCVICAGAAAGGADVRVRGGVRVRHHAAPPPAAAAAATALRVSLYMCLSDKKIYFLLVPVLNYSCYFYI